MPVPTDAAGDGRPALTLGGHRPGAYVITSRDDLWWRPCLSRAEGGIPHVYFLEPASWPSLYCPRCRDPHTVAEVAEQVRELVATGKAAEARALFTDTPIAKLFFQITIRKITASPQTGRLGHSPGSSTSRDEATAGDSRTRTPAAGVTAGETAPSGNPERDDPKAEVGSFEPPAPWRPRYRDRADWEEWKNERAAICEYLGGMQRKYAELAALRLAGDAP